MSILAITTGGTIGAVAYPDPLHPPEISSMPDQDLVVEALQTDLKSFDIDCVSLEPRDSKLIDADYRENLVQVILTSQAKAVLITHGTDTLLQTADFLYQRIAALCADGPIKIILTGSMIPLANGVQSDGYLNLHYALSQLTRASIDQPVVSLVLSDFNAQGAWKPRLYAYQPGRYEKFYDRDGRYSRLRLIDA